jgi:NAD(P)-dependent dehydrogenase (short-subunit alcohol dehydrogenase family)
MRIIQAVSIILIAAIVVFNAPANASDKQEIKSILVTGATSGIGRNLAETLASNGYHVYAGGRTQEELTALNAIKNITGVKLDVTNQDDVDAALSFIRSKGTGLYALVNNAGIGGGGPILDTPLEDQTAVYRVNVEGVYRITKAFAPLIIESKGRISTTGSIAGTISGPGFSGYSGSKHWIEAFTDSLAAELKATGVLVSVIEPGNYQTQIRRSAVRRSFEKVIAGGGEITKEMRSMYDKTAIRELSFKKPDEVVAAFMHALFDEQPLLRYVVTPNQNEQELTINTKVRKLVQLNQWGPHSYTRDQLVEMLDKAIAEEAK